MGFKEIELMSPAGSWQALEAAVNAGADAVYLGGSRFGARKYADNFDNEQLKKAVEFAHIRGVRIYVTVNILVADSEMFDAFTYLKYLSEIGIDGVIVQDLGIAWLIKKYIPQLPLFASTQLTVTNSGGVLFAENMGFLRTVLARETSLADMEKICSTVKSDIEVFVHGALCMGYSGQCLMSSLIGARSGNRGQCAQPCRLPYILVNEQGEEVLPEGSIGKYLLSPKDLSTVEILPELLKAGVNSLKIEGRMKRPEYVAVVTSIYRYAIDSYVKGDFSIAQEALRDLKQIFNRDFTTAYLKDRPGKMLLSDRRPNNRGVQVGRIVSSDRDNGLISVKLEEDITVGDELEVWVSVGGRVSTAIKELFVDREKVQNVAKGQIATFSFPHAVSNNDRVFRVFDYSLMDYARSFFGENASSSLPVGCKVTVELDKPLCIAFVDSDGNKGIGETAFIAEKARKHSLSKETIQKQVERLGNTDFYLKELIIELPDGLMVPVSEINEARRQAIENLKVERLNKFLAPREKVTVSLPKVQSGKKEYAKTLLSVHVDTLDKLKVAGENGAEVLIFGGETYNHLAISEQMYQKASEFANKHNKKIYFATPRIINETQKEEYVKDLKFMQQAKPDGIVISNLAFVNDVQALNIPFWLDYSLNAFNSWAIALWRELGAEGVMLSQEMTMTQIEEVASKTILPLECLVQGRTEMMVTEYCAIGSLLGNINEQDCTCPCIKGKYFFKDRKDELFPLVTDQFGRMHILNAKELSLIENVTRFKDMGISRIRIDGRYIDKDKLKQVVADYSSALLGDSFKGEYNDTTRGHYFRGVV